MSDAMTDTRSQTDPKDASAEPPKSVKPEKPKAELVLGSEIKPLVPRNLDEYARAAAAVYHSGVIPRSYEGKSPEETRGKLMLGMMKGAEVGLPPVSALDWIMIVNNRTTVWGDGAMMLAEQSGLVEDKQEMFMHEPPEGLPANLNDWPDEFCCTYQMRRKDRETPRQSEKPSRRHHDRARIDSMRFGCRTQGCFFGLFHRFARLAMPTLKVWTMGVSRSLRRIW